MNINDKAKLKMMEIYTNVYVETLRLAEGDMTMRQNEAKDRANRAVMDFSHNFIDNGIVKDYFH